MADAPLARLPPLEGPALKAALLDGLRLWALATGTTLSGGMSDMIEHQMTAVRRACKRVDPPNVRTRPPMRLQTQEPEPDETEQQPLPWWKRD